MFWIGFFVGLFLGELGMVFMLSLLDAGKDRDTEI